MFHDLYLHRYQRTSQNNLQVTILYLPSLFPLLFPFHPLSKLLPITFLSLTFLSLHHSSFLRFSNASFVPSIALCLISLLFRSIIAQPVFSFFNLHISHLFLRHHLTYLLFFIAFRPLRSSLTHSLQFSPTLSQPMMSFLCDNFALMIMFIILTQSNYWL